MQVNNIHSPPHLWKINFLGKQTFDVKQLKLILNMFGNWFLKCYTWTNLVMPLLNLSFLMIDFQTISMIIFLFVIAIFQVQWNLTSYAKFHKSGKNMIKEKTLRYNDTFLFHFETMNFSWWK